MKTISLCIVSCLTAMSVFAQSGVSTVTIEVNGNRAREVQIDGVVQPFDNTYASNSNKATITVPGITEGQHTLRITRMNANNKSMVDSRVFNVRSGFDLNIKVAGNGSVSIRETKQKTTQYTTAMSQSAFNTLYSDIQRQTRSSSRLTALRTAFNNSSYYFTTSQARQLILLSNSETQRLELAKHAVHRIVDPSNISQLYNVFNSQTRRNELAAYVKANINTSGNDKVYKTPMSDANFNSLYREVQNQWSASAKVTTLNNAFINTSNYFTTSQARQLILLVPDENNRLYLAKAVYRGITNPNNFSQIYDILNSQSSRNELAAYVRANGNTSENDNVYRTPMSDANFNLLFRDVQNQWSTSAKVTALNTAFGNTSNYFTTSQTRQLILLVPDENNRLYLAKASYRGITDPNNFTQLYDVLSSQASRNELAAYVRANANGSGSENAYRVPMSDANYNTLFRDVQNQYSTSAKVTALNNAFGNTSNYFTTSQARQLIMLVPDENNRLYLAKASYRSITDPNSFIQLYEVLGSQSSRNELSAYINRNYGVNYGTVYGNNNNTIRTPMSDVDYNNLYREVQNVWGLGGKMTSLSTIFSNNSYYFTTLQSKELIKLVSSETNRLELAKASYDNITDPGNFSNLYEVFSSQASRDELANWVNSYAYNNSSVGNNYSYKTPMAQTEYENLYRQVQNTWGLGAKFNSLTTIFSNNSYFFTTAQAKELVKLVSSESNRLQLAKSAYDNITDPANYLSQMNDVFSTQVSRDELATFVNSHSYN